MKLNVFERLMLLEILPHQGDITAIRIVRKLREELSFSEDEHKKLNFVQEDSLLRWDDEVDSIKDVELGDKAREIIADAFTSISDKGGFTEQHLDVYERFAEGGE